MNRSCLVLLAPFLTACPLLPDVLIDSGVVIDGGDDDGGVDAGTDGGSAASGNISAVLTEATQMPVFWAGADVANSQQSASTGQATIQGDSTASGHIVLQLTGLVSGTTTGSATFISYRDASQVTWTCSSLGGCSAVVTIGSYDGTTLTGSFEVQFAGVAGAASLTSGLFSITFGQ
jgi:hypothetical protein